jgi:hypothetical protein
MKRKFLLGLLICVSIATQAAAQERPKLFSDVERVFREKEPAWKVERAYPTTTTDPLTLGLVFRSGKQQASVEIAIWKQTTAAADVFAGDCIAFDNSAGKKMAKTTLPQLGDENHVWTNPRSTAWPMIKFRKGNVLVTVFTPSLAIGKRFAKRVLDQMVAS